MPPAISPESGVPLAKKYTLILFIPPSAAIRKGQSPISKVRSGEPDPAHICTSHVERQNLTIRMQMRRFTRLTNAFSKKLTNLKAACALHFAHYNFCRVHASLRVTPAMAAGIATHVWPLEQLLVEDQGN